jgi:archaellum component FlaF (FlaF/FlaG flagellin family)
VSTRKLIVAALVCGVVILVAGVVQLLRIADAKNRDVPILTQGEAAAVGGVSVSVIGSTVTEQAIEVAVRFAPATDVPVGVTSFTLLVGGKLEQPTNAASTPAPGCPPTIVVGSGGTTCIVSFPHRDGTATVAFSRGGQQEIWRLEPSVT